MCYYVYIFYLLVVHQRSDSFHKPPRFFSPLVYHLKYILGLGWRIFAQFLFADCDDDRFPYARRTFSHFYLEAIIRVIGTL
jgi:hypothetical protein